jgi:hypothetical protein
MKIVIVKSQSALFHHRKSQHRLGGLTADAQYPRDKTK